MRELLPCHSAPYFLQNLSSLTGGRSTQNMNDSKGQGCPMGPGWGAEAGFRGSHSLGSEVWVDEAALVFGREGEAESLAFLS